MITSTGRQLEKRFSSGSFDDPYDLQEIVAMVRGAPPRTGRSYFRGRARAILLSQSSASPGLDVHFILEKKKKRGGVKANGQGNVKLGLLVLVLEKSIA